MALAHYKMARALWVTMAERAKDIYMPDVSYGDIPQRHGHWMVRIPALDTDLAAMEKKISEKSPNPKPTIAVLETLKQRVVRPTNESTHKAAASFRPGSELPITFSLSKSVPEVVLLFRHVNQAERWQHVAMKKAGDNYQASIPADYTNSPFPLQYYFELRTANAAWFYPGFNETLSNQPYFDIFKRS